MNYQAITNFKDAAHYDRYIKEKWAKIDGYIVEQETAIAVQTLAGIEHWW